MLSRIACHGESLTQLPPEPEDHRRHQRQRHRQHVIADDLGDHVVEPRDRAREIERQGPLPRGRRRASPGAMVATNTPTTMKIAVK